MVDPLDLMVVELGFMRLYIIAKITIFTDGRELAEYISTQFPRKYGANVKQKIMRREKSQFQGQR